MVHVREDRNLFQEIIQIDKPVMLPVIRKQTDVGIITDEVHPLIRRHHAARIWKKKYEPDCTKNQMTNDYYFSKLGRLQRNPVYHQSDAKHQEWDAGKVMIDIGSAGNKHPRQELCKQTDQNKRWIDIPTVSEEMPVSFFSADDIAMASCPPPSCKYNTCNTDHPNPGIAETED